MPDSTPVTPRTGTVPRIAGLVLAVVGAAGLIASAFLTWFTVKVRPPEGTSAAAFSALEARVSGIGSVTMPAFGGIEVSASSSVPNDVAWGGWVAVGLAVAIVFLSAVAAFGPAGQRRPGAAGAGVAGVAGIALGVYAIVVPTGTRTIAVQGMSLQVDTAASAGPPIVIGASVVVLLGALVLLLARRAAPGIVAQPAPQGAHAPRAPHAPSDQQLPPVEQVWARPVALPPPTPAPDAVPETQTRTAVAPVARRRPQPDWDRNWPSAVPPQPDSRPVVPSEQHTQIVKRPPRPVKVSPKPETEAIPRYDPRYDSPTEPL